MKENEIMHIELKYFNPRTESEHHFLFPDLESEHHFLFPDLESALALDYYQDAVDCGCTILIWRLVPNDKIHIG